MQIERCEPHPGATSAARLASVLLALAVTGACTGVRDSPNPSTVADPARLLRIEPAEGTISATIDLPRRTRMITVAAGRVWVVDGTSGTLTRVDPGSNEVTTLDVGVPAAIVGRGDDLWAALDGTSLARLDGVTGDVEARFELAKSPIFALGDAGFPGIGAESLWLTVPVLGEISKPQALWRIDPQTGEVGDRIAIGVNPIAPIVEEPSVWVITRSGSGQLTRIDMATETATDVRTAGYPERMTFGNGSLWVGHVSRTVWQLEPETGSAVAMVDADGPVRGIALLGDDVWVTTDESVGRLDIGAGGYVPVVTISALTVGPSQAWGLVVAGGSLWVIVD